jgi:lipid-A-disaccharide synthase
MGAGRSDVELLVVAGEPSGDRAAAPVVRALGDAAGAVFGIGGDRLAGAGIELLAHIRDLTALGLGDSLRRILAWGRAWYRVREEAILRRPRAALLVDTPEINLPLARSLSADGVRVIWYVGPQVWAWRARRLELLRDRAEVAALVLPFEKELYDRAGVNAEFVGHPLLDVPAGAPRAEVRAALGVLPADRLVALLPGSRRAEIAALSAPMIEAGARMASAGVRSVLAPLRDAADAGLLERAEASGIALLPRDLSARDLLGAADAALVASGTATLEAALVGTPLAVVYRVGPVSWLAARLLVDVPYVGLPNWIAGRRVVPELLQDEVDGPALAEMALALLDPIERRRQQVELAEVRARLGTPGAARRVARLVRERLS